MLHTQNFAGFRTDIGDDPRDFGGVVEFKPIAKNKSLQMSS